MASRYECGERIDFDEMPSEMTVGQLETFINLLSMCDWCEGCQGRIEWLKRELGSRSPEEKERHEKNRQRLRARSAVNMAVGYDDVD